MSVQDLKEVANTVRMNRDLKVRGIKSSSFVFAGVFVFFCGGSVLKALAHSFFSAAILTLLLFTVAFFTYRIVSNAFHARKVSQGSDIVRELKRKGISDNADVVSMVEDFINNQRIASDLRKIEKKTREIQEAYIQELSTRELHDVVAGYRRPATGYTIEQYKHELEFRKIQGSTPILF